jgi:hypothetical protein
MLPREELPITGDAEYLMHDWALAAGRQSSAAHDAAGWTGFFIRSMDRVLARIAGAPEYADCSPVVVLAAIWMRQGFCPSAISAALKMRGDGDVDAAGSDHS